MDKIRSGVDRFMVHADAALSEAQNDPTELEHLRAEVEGLLTQIVDIQKKDGVR